MSTLTQKNITTVMVAKDAAGTAIASIPSNDVLGTMADGQVIAVGVPAGGGSEIVIPASSAAGSFESIRLVESQGGILIYSPKIKVSNIVHAGVKAYTAPTEQTYVLGFDGTSGNLDVTQSNEFIMNIVYDYDDMMWSEQKLRNAYNYYSTSPTLQGLATSMVTQINLKEKMSTLNGTGAVVSATMLTNGTFSASSGGAFTVANGSSTITTVESAGAAADAGKYAADASSMAVGDLIRIGGTGATSPVYVITAVSGIGTAAATITLNTPYQGTTGTVSAANTGIITTGATSFGIKVVGQPLTWVKDFFKYNKVKFHFEVKGFGASTNNKLCAICAESSKGVGSGYEVAEYESFAAGNEGALNRTMIPFPTGRTYAVSTTTYDTIAIESNDLENYSPIVGTVAMREMALVFIPVSAAIRTKLKSQLDTLLGVSL